MTEGLTVAALLDRWGASGFGVTLCSRDTLALPLVSHSFAEASAWCAIQGDFSPSCRIMLPPEAQEAPRKIVIQKLLPPAARGDVCIVVLKPTASITIGLGGPSARIFIGHFGYDFRAQINTWRDPLVCIGDQATCNGASIIADDADILVGRDCMLSDQVVLQSNDQHGIIDVGSRQIINRGRQRLALGEHSWIGRRATLMPGAVVGRGSIVSAGAVVTRDVPEASIVAGVPARLIRSNTTWCRDPSSIDNDVVKLLDELRGSEAGAG